MLVNFRKEILPFIPKADDTNDDCSDILVVGGSVAVAAHNEDANVALVGHTYAFFEYGCSCEMFFFKS